MRSRTQAHYEAVIFDLDRTLIEHDQDPTEVFHAACSAAGIEPFCGAETLELAAEVVRQRSAALDAETYERRIFETAAAATGTEIPAGKLVRAYDDALDNGAVSLRPGADAALTAATNRSTAIVTNGPADTHTTKLEAAGLTGRVDTVVYGTDTSRVKPAREPFELALERLEVDPDEVLKVGDSLSKDVKGANALGIDTAWIPFDDRDRTAGDSEPTYTIPSLSDLPGLLDG